MFFSFDFSVWQFLMQSQIKSIYFFGDKFYHFSTKISENFVFSSVNSINFGNFSEIIVKIFVTKNWKKKEKEQNKTKLVLLFYWQNLNPKKKKSEIQNSKMEWLWRFLITRNEWNLIKNCQIFIFGLKYVAKNTKEDWRLYYHHLGQ
jgi:hypothetical protein